MKLIAIDLDGTLLNSQQEISQENVFALKTVAQVACPYICSGRDPHDINQILQNYELQLPAVGLNGALGLQAERVLFDHFLLKSAADKVYQVIRSFPFKVYTNAGTYESVNYIEQMKELFARVGTADLGAGLAYQLAYEKSIISKTCTDFDQLNAQRKIRKFFVYLPNRAMKKQVAAKIAASQEVHVTESAGDNLEIVPAGVSKGAVFSQLAQIYRIEQPMKIAIGDSFNDLTMFAVADVSFAMGNSEAVIKERADFIMSTNDQHGVQEALAIIAKL